MTFDKSIGGYLKILYFLPSYSRILATLFA
jgi:hypothetical protein